jgi:hypothetical protein
MVNLTAVELIMRYISEKKIKPMKKWSLRLNASRLHSQHMNSLKKSIRFLLDLISGKDKLAMIKSYLFFINLLQVYLLILIIPLFNKGVLTDAELEYLIPKKYTNALINLVILYF